MSDWVDVSDDTHLIDEALKLNFIGSNGPYSIMLDTTAQDWISVHFGNKFRRWPIHTKAKSVAGYRLSGMADWTPEILGEACWFELKIIPRSSITYWADRKIYRTDISL